MPMTYDMTTHKSFLIKDVTKSFDLNNNIIRFLESQGVLQKLELLLKESRNDPFADVLTPALIKFFGNIAHLRPKQMIVQHTGFLDCLLEMTDSNDLVHKVVAFETIGYIGVSLEGKTALNDLGNKFANSLDKLENLVQDAPTELRIRGMNAFASLVKLDKENQRPEMLAITEAWFSCGLGSKPLGLLAGLVRQPFPELRLAAYQILANIAKQGTYYVWLKT